MAVDRVRRDAAADALASFLRGELGREAFRAALQRLDQERAPAKAVASDRDAYLDEALGPWFFEESYTAVSAEGWSALCRHLAFLKTDLEERPWHDPDRVDEDRPRQILLARWHTLGLLIAAGVAYLTHWLLFAVATVISFLLYLSSQRRYDAVADEKRWKELERRFEYHPFADRTEWLAHRHLVDEYHLPPYDASAFDEPPRARRWSSFVTVPVGWMCGLLFAVALLYMYLFSVALWPVWLVMMSLCRRDADHGR